ncbi:GNAT family acetyltransferase [Sphingomonas sp. ABOLD]|uniref:Ribosomal protein S18 acetylase RimI-like enzyme n=1 Tax=Sphingomonas trueperi TaxID=53317 RepID=A0A7X5Y0I0_9SPHN|nr:MULTISPECIES: GNAT family acetyltransferase [Sphingomonas]NJB98398.1 ribosomal protein S18 acetylase RimI-like enzyme [Sphingomonas trueperi]RSV45224.1 GNAT family acetyltransferase [Sphingomonas sp. ABOLD]
MQIREASVGDRDDVIALWQAAGLTRPWNDPVADFDRAVQGATSAILLLRDGDALLGTAMVGEDGHRGWVYYLAVAESARGQGHGRALMAAAEAWLRARGCPKLQLMVREGNDAAIGFYRAVGLEVQPVVTLGRFLH